MLVLSTGLLALATLSSAHTMGWAPGMYCKGGNNTGVDDQNTNLAVNPLYQLSLEDMWFQHDRGCDKAPPPEGEFLELPAGGQVTVEHAHNRAQTTLSYGGKYASEWPDGGTHPEDWNGNAFPPENCIQDDGALHVSNQSTAAGTALAISYHSDIEDVTLDNLVVFTVLEKTPWKRIASYDIPKDLPACPPGGCTCAWLWIPKGCGIPNMYMAGYKCNVTGATSTTPLAAAKPAVFCGDDPSKCVTGAKQMLVWHQLTGNNVDPPAGVSPGYNEQFGYLSGAQNDIFETGAAGSVPTTAASSSSAPAALPSPTATSFSTSTVTKSPLPSTSVKPSKTQIVVPSSTKAPLPSTSVKPSKTQIVVPSSTKAPTTSAAGCYATGYRRQHRRAIGRFVESLADKMGEYDI